MPILKRVLRYLKPYRSRIGLILFCMAGMAALNFCTIGGLQPIVDLLFPNTAGKIQIIPAYVRNLNPAFFESINQYAMAHRWNMFVGFCGALVLAGFLRFVFTYAQQFMMEYLCEKVMIDIRKELYAHLHSLSMRYFTSKDTGSQMARITYDVDIIGRSLVYGTGEMIRQPLMMLGLLVLMFVSSWKLSLVTLVFFPVMVIPLIRFGQKIRVQTRKLQDERALLNKLLMETISGIRIVKAFGMEDFEKQRFQDRIQALFYATVRIIRFGALSTPLTEFFGVLGIVGTLVITAYFVYLGDLSVGRFSTFLVALFSFYQPLKTLSNANNQLQGGLVGAERVFQLLDTPSDVIESPSAIPLVAPQKEIRFEHVSFAYDYKTPVLKDINLSLPLNKVIAIVGPSGAGKSTLINLIPRFYDPTEGGIYLDGINIREFQLKSLRRKTGMVTQDTILFDDTVFNNIAYGSPDYDVSKVEDAARVAHAHDFIITLPEGYQTRIGERGVKLSGGQKQRIAIARSILKNPPILIFDEATSSLDAESERLVQDALEKLMANRTTFVIAHRLSTILRADWIIVLDKGELIEIGTHHDLLAKQGLYSKLYQTQFAHTNY